jgi:hypothetical protein
VTDIQGFKVCRWVLEEEVEEKEVEEMGVEEKE